MIISFVNVFLVFVFIRMFKKRIDKVVRDTDANENEEKEVYASKYTLMF